MHVIAQDAIAQLRVGVDRGMDVHVVRGEVVAALVFVFRAGAAGLVVAVGEVDHLGGAGAFGRHGGSLLWCGLGAETSLIAGSVE